MENAEEIVKEYAAELLDIRTVEIVKEDIDIPRFKMAFDQSRNLICLSDSFAKKAAPQELIFGLSHEVAHAWQYKQLGNGVRKYEKAFKDYLPASEIPTEEYNRQLLEVEANIYGTVVALCNGFQPTFEALSEDLREEIYKKAKLLIEKFNNLAVKRPILELI